MLAQKAKQLLRPPLKQRLLTPIQFLRGIPTRNSHRLLFALCGSGGADHTLGLDVDPEVVTDRNDLVFEPIGALGILAVDLSGKEDRQEVLEKLASLVRSVAGEVGVVKSAQIGLERVDLNLDGKQVR